MAERIDDLQVNGLKLIQDSDKFCFGTDAVELANFCEVSSRDRAVELGSGSGVISVLLAGKLGIGHVTGIEIQSDMAELMRRNIELNGLGKAVSVINAPLQNIADYFKKGDCNVVVTNPPYRKVGSGFTQSEDGKAISRHEILVTLAEVLDAAAYLLGTGGRLFLVHHIERLSEVIYECKIRKLEPKKLRLVMPKEGKKPAVFLLKCIKEAAEGTDVEITTRTCDLGGE